MRVCLPANGAGIVTTGGSVSVVNGAGGLLQNGGNVTMASTNVTASGNGGFGFLFNNGGSANAAVQQWDDHGQQRSFRCRARRPTLVSLTR